MSTYIYVYIYIGIYIYIYIYKYTYIYSDLIHTYIYIHFSAACGASVARNAFTCAGANEHGALLGRSGVPDARALRGV